MEKPTLRAIAVALARALKRAPEDAHILRKHMLNALVQLPGYRLGEKDDNGYYRFTRQNAVWLAVLSIASDVKILRHIVPYFPPALPEGEGPFALDVTITTVKYPGSGLAYDAAFRCLGDGSRTRFDPEFPSLVTLSFPLWWLPSFLEGLENASG